MWGLCGRYLVYLNMLRLFRKKNGFHLVLSSYVYAEEKVLGISWRIFIWPSREVTVEMLIYIFAVVDSWLPNQSKAIEGHILFLLAFSLIQIEQIAILIFRVYRVDFYTLSLNLHRFEYIAKPNSIKMHCKCDYLLGPWTWENWWDLQQSIEEFLYWVIRSYYLAGRYSFLLDSLDYVSSYQWYAWYKDMSSSRIELVSDSFPRQYAYSPILCIVSKGISFLSSIDLPLQLKHQQLFQRSEKKPLN